MSRDSGVTFSELNTRTSAESWSRTRRAIGRVNSQAGRYRCQMPEGLKPESNCETVRMHGGLEITLLDYDDNKDSQRGSHRPRPHARIQFPITPHELLPPPTPPFTTTNPHASPTPCASIHPRTWLISPRFPRAPCCVMRWVISCMLLNAREGIAWR
jgi:hypothetical protein